MSNEPATPSRFPSPRNGNGRGTFIDVFKTILTSPVGGWALAVIVVAYISWVTMEDRKAIYADMRYLRDVVMPVIRDGPRVGFENQKLIEANHQLLKEIRSELWKIEKMLPPQPAGYVPYGVETKE